MAARVRAGRASVAYGSLTTAQPTTMMRGHADSGARSMPRWQLAGMAPSSAPADGAPGPGRLRSFRVAGAGLQVCPGGACARFARG